MAKLKKYNINLTDKELEKMKNISLPQRLVLHLPDAETIVITSYGNGENSFGVRYSLGDKYSFRGESFIQYHPLERSYDYACSVFGNSFHPFFQEFTENEKICSENMLKDFPENINRPEYFEISEDTLFVDMGGGYYKTAYQETSNYIKYRESCRESAHDGGGYCSKEWFLYAASGKKAKQELSQKRVLNEISLPTCKGYWIEEEHLYLVEPWELPGVFEYYCCKTECRDYDSDEMVWEVGVKCLEN